MSKNVIDKKQFTEWASEAYQLYASESVPARRNLVKRLTLYVNPIGEFKVELGGKQLYKGFSFDEAKEAYENIG